MIQVYLLNVSIKGNVSGWPLRTLCWTLNTIPFIFPPIEVHSFSFYALIYFFFQILLFLIMHPVQTHRARQKGQTERDKCSVEC